MKGLKHEIRYVSKYFGFNYLFKVQRVHYHNSFVHNTNIGSVNIFISGFHRLLRMWWYCYGYTCILTSDLHGFVVSDILWVIPLIAFQTNRSDAHRVVLKDVQPNHTGKYRCEVSGDSPSFNTMMVSGYMHVVSEYLEKRILYLCKDSATCTAKAGRKESEETCSYSLS